MNRHNILFPELQPRKVETVWFVDDNINEEDIIEQYEQEYEKNLEAIRLEKRDGSVFMSSTEAQQLNVEEEEEEEEEELEDQVLGESDEAQFEEEGEAWR